MELGYLDNIIQLSHQQNINWKRKPTKGIWKRFDISYKLAHGEQVMTINSNSGPSYNQKVSTKYLQGFGLPSLRRPSTTNNSSSKLPRYCYKHWCSCILQLPFSHPPATGDSGVEKHAFSFKKKKGNTKNDYESL